MCTCVLFGFKRASQVYAKKLLLCFVLSRFVWFCFEQRKWEHSCLKKTFLWQLASFELVRTRSSRQTLFLILALKALMSAFLVKLWLCLYLTQLIAPLR